jgi:hypothetical protein
MTGVNIADDDEIREMETVMNATNLENLTHCRAERAKGEILSGTGLGHLGK